MAKAVYEREIGVASSADHYKPQGPPLGSIETKIASQNGKHSVSTIVSLVFLCREDLDDRGF